MQSVKNLTALQWKDTRAWALKQRWILLILLVTAGFIVVFNQHRARFLFKPPRARAVLMYEEMLKRLEKQGIKRKPHWTARELLNSDVPDEKREQAQRVIDYYEKVRFGNVPASPDMEKELRTTLNSI